MKKYLVIGNPISHSLSPKLHNYWLRLNNIDAKYIEIIKSYIIDSMECIDKSLIYEVSENSSIFIDLNRYIINK